MCGFITLSFSAITRGAATSQNWGVHPSSLPSSFLSSIHPSLLPCFPTLCLFLPFFLSLRPCLRSFLNPSPLSLSFVHSSLFFPFPFSGAHPRHLKPSRGVRESCKPDRQTISVHSDVKTGYGEWWQQCWRGLHTTNVNYRRWSWSQEQSLMSWLYHKTKLSRSSPDFFSSC